MYEKEKLGSDGLDCLLEKPRHPSSSACLQYTFEPEAGLLYTAEQEAGIYTAEQEVRLLYTADQEVELLHRTK